MVTYNDLVRQLNESYENSRNPHNYVDDLKEMRESDNIEKIINLYYDIMQNNYWTFRGTWGNNEYKSALEQELNNNILRIFKETKDPSEAQFLRCLVNLRGEYNQWAGVIIKEANNKKNLLNADAQAQEALSVKIKYDDAWIRIKECIKDSNGYYKVLKEVGSLLDKMNDYGYIHTKSEKDRIKEYGLGKIDYLKYVIIAICFIGFLAFEWWLLSNGGGAWFLVILFLLVWLKGK